MVNTLKAYHFFFEKFFGILLAEPNKALKKYNFAILNRKVHILSLTS